MSGRFRGGSFTWGGCRGGFEGGADNGGRKGSPDEMDEWQEGVGVVRHTIIRPRCEVEVTDHA